MITQKPNLSKILEYKQDGKNYKLELSQNLNNILFLIKDINEINENYKLEVSFEDIQNKNISFRIYKNIEELINSIQQFILNKNISLIKNNNGLTLDLFIYNIMGNKEKVSFEFNKTENTNKDEIIKSLCFKLNNMEEKYNKLNEKYCELNEKYCQLNEKYEKLEKKYEKIMTVVGSMIEEKEGKLQFQWENNDNFELSNNNKTLKKIKNKGWNSNIKGNKILKKNALNIFKIRVNNINSDKSGLCFGIEKASSNSTLPSNDEEWNMSCINTSKYKYKDFKKETINKGDIVTFIVDLNKGSLSVKKNDVSLGVLYDIPKNEDLVPCVFSYYEGDEIEIIE